MTKIVSEVPMMPNTIPVIVWDDEDAREEVILGRLHCDKAENDTFCEVGKDFRAGAAQDDERRCSIALDVR